VGGLTGWVLAPRRPGLFGRVAINLGLQAGQAGFFLLVSYALITYPGHGQPELDDQTTPAVMWQVALALALVGALVLLLVLVLTPRVDANAPAQAKFPLAWTIPVGMLVANFVIAVVAALVADENGLRWWPLFFWALMSIAGFYYWWKDR
jgi:uncharacterized Tic20 family protein